MSPPPYSQYTSLETLKMLAIYQLKVPFSALPAQLTSSVQPEPTQ